MTAIPIATGMPHTASTTKTRLAPTTVSGAAARTSATTTSTSTPSSAPANATHFICCRAMPDERRNRTTIAVAPARRLSISSTQPAQRPTVIACEKPSTPTGLVIERAAESSAPGSSPRPNEQGDRRGDRQVRHSGGRLGSPVGEQQQGQRDQRGGGRRDRVLDPAPTANGRRGLERVVRVLENGRRGGEDAACREEDPADRVLGSPRPDQCADARIRRCPTGRR